jgi:zinc transport system substrate-binding protein
MNKQSGPLSVLVFVATLLAALPAFAQVSVVTSIKPLHMIASAITDGVSEPVLLIPSTQSYHHFALRPSNVRTLSDADLFVWVGPELESYLTGAVEAQMSGKQVLQILALPDLLVHHAGHDGEDVVHIVVPDEGLHAGHQHRAGDDIDPHVWLDTRNGRAIARAIASSLSEADPVNSTRYQHNLARFEQSLSALETRLEDMLVASDSTRYAVYHDAFRYFERQFGLQHEVVFVGSEEMQPGARHLLALREAIDSRDINCLLEDVTSQAATVETVIGKKDVSRIHADTTGRNLTSGASAYIQLIDNLATAFQQCFDR